MMNDLYCCLIFMFVALSVDECMLHVGCSHPASCVVCLHNPRCHFTVALGIIQAS